MIFVCISFPEQRSDIEIAVTGQQVVMKWWKL